MISFSSAPGNLYNRLGKLGALVKNVKTNQTTQQTAMTDPSSGVTAQLAGEADLQSLMGSAYLGILGGVEGASSTAQTIAQQVIGRMVFRDNPQLGQDLSNPQVLESIIEVIRQMKLAGATIQSVTVTSSNSGQLIGASNGITFSSVKRPLDGQVLQNAFSETVNILCSADSYTGGVTAFNETFTITGETAQTDVFAFDWPRGSGANTTLQAIDGDTSNGSGNLLTNSGFATFVNTPNVPDKWTLTVGTAGTNIFQETGLVFSGPGAVRLLGDGTTLTSFQQQFGSSTGTTATLSPLTQYSICLFLRRDGTAAGQGILTVDLCDQNGVVILDANNVPNTFNIDLTALNAFYAAYAVAVRTPLILPSSYSIRYHLTTPLTNGRSVYIDKTSMGLMTQIATSCPFVSVHSGAVPAQQNDYGDVIITNSRGAGGTLSTFQTLLAQLMDPFVLGQEILFPSSASPTISDSLIG